MRIGLMVMGAALFTAAFPASAPQHIPLAMQRTSPQDLEVSGDLPDVPQGQKRFIRFADLNGQTQVTFTVKDDSNFDHPVKLSGVPLDTLVAALGVTGKTFVTANSSDGYEGHYSSEYRAQHHPFLVLRIDGLEPAHWPKSPEGENYGPFLISHASFTPAYHVLAQKDEPQIPYGVVSLRFLDEATVLKELLPPGGGAPTSPPMEGYRIVMQNCLRCHRNGDIGGTKSPFGWPQMALIAQGNPTAFGKYVVRPNSVNPEANMPANPEYDAATVAALTAYFRSFAPGETK